MFNFKRKSVQDYPTPPTPVKEVIKSSNNNLKIGSVKHLMPAAIVTNQAINSQSESNTKTGDLKLQVEDNLTVSAIETTHTIDEKQTPPEIKYEELNTNPEFKPFTKITPPEMEKKPSMPTIPKNVCTWFVNNLSNYMNGLPIEQEKDFYTLMSELTENDDLNPAPSHIGLHKIRHFIKTQMGHMFDVNKDEFITINLPALDKGVILMGPTPDNNIVLAGNLSSLETADWEGIHKELQAQLK